MRSQDKRNAVDYYRKDATAREAAEVLNVPVSEVQAIFAKEKRKREQRG